MYTQRPDGEFATVWFRMEKMCLWRSKEGTLGEHRLRTMHARSAGLRGLKPRARCAGFSVAEIGNRKERLRVREAGASAAGRRTAPLCEFPGRFRFPPSPPLTPHPLKTSRDALHLETGATTLTIACGARQGAGVTMGERKTVNKKMWGRAWRAPSRKSRNLRFLVGLGQSPKKELYADRRTKAEYRRRAAQLLLENGSETYRVEETARRMAKGFGIGEINIAAFPTSVFWRRVGARLCGASSRRGTNSRRIAMVNAISREVEQGRLSPEAAGCALEKGAEKPRLSQRTMILAYALAAARLLPAL